MKALLKKEWLLAMRQLHDLLQPLFFVLMVVTLFPLAIGVEEPLLQSLAPGVIWIATLLSILLATEKCYKNDFEDGSLEQLLLSGRSLLWLTVAKVLVLWIVQILPLLLALPVLGLFYGMSMDVGFQLALTMVIASPTLLLLGMLGSALTLSMARGGLLLMLIVLPLYIPSLIFSVSAVSSHVEGFSNTGQLAILGAILMITLVVIPFAISATIKASLAER